MIAMDALLEWLKADPSDEAIIRELEQAAVRNLQQRTGRYLGPVAAITEYPRWYGWPIALANAPIGGVITSLEQWDGAAWSVVDAATYYIEDAYLWSVGTWSPPNITRFRATYQAGYTAHASDPHVWAAPEDVQQAVKLLVAHWFENREAVNIGNITTEVPLGVGSLIEPYVRVVV